MTKKLLAKAFYCTEGHQCGCVNTLHPLGLFYGQTDENLFWLDKHKQTCKGTLVQLYQKEK